MKNNYRFYSFVAGLYLSPIQCGIQTAHAVADMSVQIMPAPETNAYKEWARDDKVLIVCQAINHAGVCDAYEQLQTFGAALSLPTVIFREDEQSMNGMATAAGIVVPECFYDAKPFRNFENEVVEYRFYPSDFNEYDLRRTYSVSSVEGRFIEFLKSYRLA